MLAGIAMGPNYMGDWTAEAYNLGADTAYPYQGENKFISVGSVIQQASGTNDSTAAALAAIEYALSSNKGLVDILAYSAAAAAFTAAYGELSDSQRSRIGLVLYLSPGAATEIANVKGTTSVVLGSGVWDVLATIGTQIPQGVPVQNSDCAHTDIACLLKQMPKVLAQMAENGDCSSPEVFTRTNPSGVPGIGFPSPGAGEGSSGSGGNLGGLILTSPGNGSEGSAGPGVFIPWYPPSPQPLRPL
jgi:hypothetical protein